MPPKVPPSPYDEIAGMYHAMWADWYLPAAMSALEKLFFSQVPSGARVLDVCCGSGHVTKELVERGYRITGIDSSGALIAIARRHLPGVDLRVQDARTMRFEIQYDAAISTFDSLNHIMSLGELYDVFAAVSHALNRGGLFLFDMNLEEAYSADLRQWTVQIDDDSVGLARGTYDFVLRKATTELIWFLRAGNDNCWSRRQSVVEQRCYDQSEIIQALAETGFAKVEVIRATEAGVCAGLGFGRIFLTGRTQG